MNREKFPNVFGEYSLKSPLHDEISQPSIQTQSDHYPVTAWAITDLGDFRD
jgi:hypothetical protein